MNTLPDETGDATRIDARALADLRGLPLPGVSAALDDGVLSFGPHYGAPAWFIRDEWAGCARRLDGKPWRMGGSNAKAAHVCGTSGRTLPGWPVGLICA